MRRRTIRCRLERVEQAERRAAWIVGISRALLCGYVLVSAGSGRLLHAEADRSLIGLGLAGRALLVSGVWIWPEHAALRCRSGSSAASVARASGPNHRLSAYRFPTELWNLTWL